MWLSIAALAMVVTMVGVGGCSGDRAAKTETAGTGAESGLALRVEGLAEDVQTDLDSGAWAASAEKLRQLRASRDSTVLALRGARGAGGGDAGPSFGIGPPDPDAFSAAIQALEEAIARRDRLAGLMAANRVSRTLLPLLAAGPGRVPVAVSALDVAIRDVEYAAESGNWTAAAAMIDEADSVYAKVREHVAGKSPGLDATVRERIASLRWGLHAHDAHATRPAVDALLEDVDRIEATY